MKTNNHNLQELVRLFTQKIISVPKEDKINLTTKRWQQLILMVEQKTTKNSQY